MRKVTLLILFLFSLSQYNHAQVRRLLRKAAHSTEKGNMEKSKQYYRQILEKDKDNYKANAGLGITLHEFMDQPEEALPYLENAYKHTPKDTLPDLVFALGKCYQHHGRYSEALWLFEWMTGARALDDDNKLFQLELKKRKEDCKYAMEHTAFTPPRDWYVVNVGNNINTSMPEYVPVITPFNELLFTSKRKDDKKEKISDLDGKYFESMYTSKIENGRFAPPRRYTIPDLFLKSHFRKHHESVISMSPDGTKLFVYRDNKIYEVTMDHLGDQEPKKLSKSINFGYYQNHAYLSKDGKTLLFTSEAKSGIGGTDIYRSEKMPDGTWSKPENLGAPVNTEYDEDAPFLTDDNKTLFFASKGHQGYGNFDLYSSEFTDGKWTTPVNLGQPINSSAHDIFMVRDGEGHLGYFSSSRVGGKGDMDIYKVNYLVNFKKECLSFEDRTLVLESAPLNDSNRFSVTASLPSHYNILSYDWNVAGENVKGDTYIEYQFKSAGHYPVKLKVIAYCDTCMEPYVACNSIMISAKGIELVATTTNTASGTSTSTTSSTVTTSGDVGDIKDYKGLLSNEQLLALGFDIQPLLFEYNSSRLQKKAMEVISKNAAVLKKNPSLSVEIYGYADSQGPDVYNSDLSSKRARNVKSQMLKSGVRTKQISKVLGKGEIPCEDEKSCEQSRKVEFVVFKK